MKVLQSFDFDLRTNAGDVPHDRFDLQGLVSKGPGTGLRDTSATQRAQAEVTDRPGSELILTTPQEELDSLLL